MKRTKSNRKRELIARETKRKRRAKKKRRDEEKKKTLRQGRDGEYLR